MSEGDDIPDDDRREYPEARVRPRRTLSWVWLAPIFAAAVVLWLAWRSLSHSGPAIVIDFISAEGLQEGQTKIRFKGVDVGTVESLELSPDMSRVQVHARMTHAVAGFLGDGVRFWIVAPRVGAGGVTGLSTIVSGSYIEMFPGHGGAQQRHFVGLEQPPLLQPDTPGRSFTLVASELGSLVPGAQLTYHGVAVGELEGYSLAGSHQEVQLYAFVRAPYDALVHPETRFWNEGGIDVTAGATGVRFRVSSWQQLLIGGIAFDTPAAALARPASAAGAQFRLYDSRSSAERDPRTTPLVYHVVFLRPARGVQRGTPVELQGTDVGSVTEAHFVYDDSRQSLTTRATLTIDPSVIEIAGAAERAPAEHAAEVKLRVEQLLAHGLRARVMTSSFLTGLRVIALDVLPNAPAPARVAGSDEIPTAAAADVDEMLASLQSTIHNLDRATGGPELAHAVKSLDETLSHLSRISADLEPQIGPLVSSLRATAQAAQDASTAVGTLVGTGSRTEVDMPRLMEQLNDAARAVRELADYLDRHPEALLRGRRGDAR